MAKTEIKVPDIGDSADVAVIEVLVKDGDTVTKEQSLIVLESEKATMDVPSPAAGVISGIAIKVGDKVSKGTLIAQLEAGEAEPAAKPEAEKEDSKADPEKGAAADKQPPAEDETAEAEEPAKAEAEPAESAKQETSAPIGVSVPDIGDFTGVPVIEVLVKNGDVVKAEQSLLVLETDKATMEVPSPAAGTVQGFKIKVGDKVSKGDAICQLQAEASATPTKAAAPKKAAITETPDKNAAESSSKDSKPTPKQAPLTEASSEPAIAEPATPQAASGKPGELPYAGPATRKFARELGVDLSKVKGSGKNARITVEDVQGHVKQAMQAPPSSAAPSAGGGIPPIPAQDFSVFGEVETKPLARIRKLSAAHVHRSWLNIPHVTQNDEADITDLEAFRKAQSDEGGIKLTLLPFVMKAVEKALAAFPDFNSSLAPDGASLIYKHYFHVGFAADTPNGLVVPVVRDVDKKGIVQLANECGELAKKARDGKLKPDEMKGGCFSISSLGGIGGSHFTPIVNAPEVAILGVSRGMMKPVWDGKTFQPRLMLPLSLSYDHRVIDGALAARFIVLLVKLLGDLRRLAL